MHGTLETRDLTYDASHNTIVDCPAIETHVTSHFSLITLLSLLSVCLWAFILDSFDVTFCGTPTDGSVPTSYLFLYSSSS